MNKLKTFVLYVVGFLFPLMIPLTHIERVWVPFKVQFKYKLQHKKESVDFSFDSTCRATLMVLKIVPATKNTVSSLVMIQNSFTFII